ncbi:hypothetical protein QLX08_010174 [Tetragonisca angustula]|uniref:Lysosome-associated membrane glycoprotein 5 n=1 Tax=Tetragonisca angustula TaxID=166442 RepID=A0AAW0ZDP5_9HYME
MNRRHLKFLFVHTLIVIALLHAINGSELATRSENQIATFGTEEKANFTYVLTSVTTKPCILANMIITIKVPYKTQDKVDYKSLVVPDRNVTIDGHCSGVISYMNIIWNATDEKNNSIKFTFINDHTYFSLFSTDLNIYRDKKHFENTTDKEQWFRATSDVDLRLFVTPVENGIHKCSNKTLNFKKGEVIMQNVSLIAFNRNDNFTLRQEVQCPKEQQKSETFPYVLKDANNKACAMARMSILLTVPFKTKKSETGIANIDLSKYKINVDGDCQDTVTMMTLTWPSGDSSAYANKKENKITLSFVKKKTTSELYYVEVQIFTDEENFKDVERVGELISINTRYDASLFPAPVANGVHSCPKQTNVTSSNGNITISDVLLVAFDAETDFATKKVIDCRSILFEDDFAYVIKNKNTGIPCTLANMSITASVKENKERTLSVLTNATATGFCADKYSQMVLSWPVSQKANNVKNSITFHIGQNKTHFFVFQIAATIYPGANDKKKINGASYTGINLFSAAVANGIYHCSNSIFDIELGDIRLTITNVTFIAFYSEENIYSGNLTECKTETSTTTKPTSTPQPTPIPEPKPNVHYNYYVNSTSNVICIAANMSIFIEVPYKTTENKDRKGTLNVPSNASVAGECGDKLSVMKLNWMVNGSKENNTVTVNFEKDDSNYFIRSVNLSVYLDDHNFPNHRDKSYNASTASLNEFSTPLNNVYKCARNTSLTAKDAKIVITNVALIAFNTKQTITSQSVDCVDDDDTSESNAGAIAGGIIGGIIVLVGIISLVVLYRRRRGY